MEMHLRSEINESRALTFLGCISLRAPFDLESKHFRDY